MRREGIFRSCSEAAIVAWTGQRTAGATTFDLCGRAAAGARERPSRHASYIKLLGSITGDIPNAMLMVDEGIIFFGLSFLIIGGVIYFDCTDFLFIRNLCGSYFYFFAYSSVGYKNISANIFNY
jgi:hypothetical protein